MSAQEPQVVDSSEFIELLDYQFTGDNYTVERKRTLVGAFREEGSIYHAAIAAHVSRKTVYNWIEQDEQFAQAIEDSKEDCYDKAESSVYRKAIAGDSLLLMFYLKAHRPKFRDKLQVDLEVLDSEIRERMASLNPQLLPAITGYLGDGDNSQLVQNPSESDNQQKSE